jgi:hypothetical protein
MGAACAEGTRDVDEKREKYGGEWAVNHIRRKANGLRKDLYSELAFSVLRCSSEA